MSFETNHLKEQYVVEGMTCAACVRAVEKAVSRVEGVKNPVVNLSSERLTFEVSHEIDEDRLFEAVRNAGYNLKNMQTTRKAVIEIDGMTCAACVATVEKAIGKLDGINRVSVSLSSDTASFEYDPHLLRIGEVKRVIEKAGYKAGSLVTEKSCNESLK